MTLNVNAPTSSAEPHSQLEAADHATAGRAQRLVAAGGILGAIAASSCCIVPLVLFSLGVSGAWIGQLTRLAPYQPYIIAATLGLLGYGVWLARRARHKACAPGAACARRLPGRIVTIAMIVAVLLTAAAAAFDFLAPALLD